MKNNLPVCIALAVNIILQGVFSKSMHELKKAKNRKSVEGLGKVEARLLGEGGFNLAQNTPLLKTRFRALKHERWISNSACFVTP